MEREKEKGRQTVCWERIELVHFKWLHVVILARKMGPRTSGRFFCFVWGTLKPTTRHAMVPLVVEEH